MKKKENHLEESIIVEKGGKPRRTAAAAEVEKGDLRCVLAPTTFTKGYGQVKQMHPRRREVDLGVSMRQGRQDKSQGQDPFSGGK